MAARAVDCHALLIMDRPHAAESGAGAVPRCRECISMISISLLMHAEVAGLHSILIQLCRPCRSAARMYRQYHRIMYKSDMRHLTLSCIYQIHDTTCLQPPSWPPDAVLPPGVSEPHRSGNASSCTQFAVAPLPALIPANTST